MRRGHVRASIAVIALLRSVVLLAVSPPPVDVKARSPQADAGTRPGDVPFDRGGQGLALVLASYVLDQHGAQVWQTAGPATIHVRLSRQQ